MPRLDVVPVGWVESPLVERTQAPRQGDEGAPPAWLVFEARTGEAIRDLDAVRAALSEPWSNGQVEGQVNRLKVIKREMYGRAGFDLLRCRVLGHA